MKPKPIFFVMLALMMVILGACKSDGDGGSLRLFGAEPTALDSSSAETVATTFLDAWRERDYPTMYSLITPNARDAFSQDEFVRIYESINTQLTLHDLTWGITAGPLIQGSSATLEYKVTFDTGLLGIFTDPDTSLPDTEPRTMWLTVVPNEGWRIAWSRMDIFAEWTNSSSLYVERVPPARGNIYDRNGKVLVDQNGTVVGVVVNESTMPSRDLCANELARIFRREIGDVYSVFDQYLDSTEFLFGEISQDSANVEDGVLRAACNYSSRPRKARQYYDRVASHIIGYVGQIPADRQADYLVQGYPADALVGLSGIEQAYENELRGTIGIRLQIRSSSGITIRTVATRPAAPGQSVYLTIDRDLQLATQALVADAYDNAQATWAPGSRGGAVVVMEVNTGEILAIVSYPDYDPSIFSPDTQIQYFNAALEIQNYRDDPRAPLLNRATRGSYPLGSVMKIFSMVAGLDSGEWLAGNVINCTGSWDGTVFNDRLRTDWLPTGHGPIDMKSSLVQSCNPYNWSMAMAMNTANPNLLSEYFKKFGFGTATPFQGIPTEAGLVPSPDWKIRQASGIPWTNSDAANLVIGQGDVGVTPLQVVAATAMVANGGTLYNPMIVKQIGIIGQEPDRIEESSGMDLGLSKDVLALTREAMCDVTLMPYGTANFIYQDWYVANNFQVIVCGKTGTAQSGQTDPHAWFAAYAPRDNPEIAVISIIENSCEGSEVSAPIVRRVIESYYQLPTAFTDFGWPPLWQYGCTLIGPD